MRARFCSLCGMLCASIATACHSSTESTAQSPHGRLVVERDPIAWQRDGKLIYSRVVKWVSGDVAQPRCDGTGLFTIDENGHERVWKATKTLCDILWHVQRVNLTPDGGSLLYADDLHGGEIVRLDLDRDDTSIVRKTCVPHLSSPSWSTNANRIAFTANCPDPNRWQLFTMGSDGSNAAPLDTLGDHGMADNPSWSRDDRFVAFVRGNGVSVGTIVVASAVTGGEQTLGPGDVPVWAPTDKWIAYRGADSELSIDLVHPDGSEHRRLVTMHLLRGSVQDRGDTDARFAGHIAWAPDGKRLAFAEVSPGHSEIWTINLDGTGLKRASPR
jgi:Tol biopolymer transport system component